jgi:hypothetical protein
MYVQQQSNSGGRAVVGQKSGKICGLVPAKPIVLAEFQFRN